MGTFELTRTMIGDPTSVFSAVGDLQAYGDYLPMTRIEHDRAPIGPGWSFTGYSGVRPFVLIDRMQVTTWEPPFGFAVRKRGPILDGWAEVELEAVEPSDPTDPTDPSDLSSTAAGPRTLVRWRENITVRPAPIGRLAAPATDRFNTWLFGRALDAMAARCAA